METSILDRRSSWHIILFTSFSLSMVNRQINANGLVAMHKKSVDHGNTCTSETVKLIKTGWMNWVWISTRWYGTYNTPTYTRTEHRWNDRWKTPLRKSSIGLLFPVSSMFRDSVNASVPVSREISLIFGKLEGGRFTNDAKYARFMKPPNNLIGLRQISRKEEESISNRP